MFLRRVVPWPSMTLYKKIISKNRRWGIFPSKKSESPSSETTAPIEKNQRGCKNGSDILYLYGGKRKVGSFFLFVCLSRTE